MIGLKRNGSRLKNQSGMTLVEMLIAILITGILIIGLTGFAKIFQEQFSTHRDVFETEQSIYFAMESLIREIREARSIEPSPSSTSSQISLINSNSIPVTYRIDPNDSSLKRQEGSGEFVVVAEHVDTANSRFSYDTKYKVVTIVLKGLFNDNEVILENSAYLRNSK